VTREIYTNNGSKKDIRNNILNMSTYNGVERARIFLSPGIFLPTLATLILSLQPRETAAALLCPGVQTYRISSLYNVHGNEGGT